MLLLPHAEMGLAGCVLRPSVVSVVDHNQVLAGVRIFRPSALVLIAMIVLVVRLQSVSYLARGCGIAGASID